MSGYESEDLEEYDPEINWYPKLFVENAIYDKYYEEISYRITKIDGKTLITETRVCKGNFCLCYKLEQKSYIKN